MVADGKVSGERKLDAQRLAALFLAGWLLLNFPLLGVFDVGVNLMGVPALLLALFVLWMLLIIATAWLVDWRGSAEGDN